eukprot:GHVN01080769.1.p1 GENE.GHVN01080769.1~~GHVN01080769.1.p1  ORF type:complete len:297 (+),score=60.18 GHVN01080769.1:1445-2335(+)
MVPLVMFMMVMGLGGVVAQGENPYQMQKLNFCDNVEIEATQKGVRVELLLQPFGLVCVMADVMAGGALGKYLEEGLVSWTLDTEEKIEGMGLLDAGPTEFGEVPAYFASLAEQYRLIHPRNEGDIEFGSAFVSTVMGLSIETPGDVASRTLANRLASVPPHASQFEVLAAVMGLDMWNDASDVESALIQRFRFPEGGEDVTTTESAMIKQHTVPQRQHTSPPAGNTRATRVSEMKRPEMSEGHNAISAQGDYENPGGSFIFPDRAINSLVGDGDRWKSGGIMPQVRGQLENFIPLM